MNKMLPDACRSSAARLLVAAGFLSWPLAAASAEEPLSVTYGPAALTAEGDQDYHEIIYLSVPDTTPEFPTRYAMEAYFAKVLGSAK